MSDFYKNEKKLDLLIEKQEETNKLLRDLIKIFSQYDQSYSRMIEEDGLVKSPT